MSGFEPEFSLRYELIHSFSVFQEHLHCGTVQSGASDLKCEFLNLLW